MLRSSSSLAIIFVGAVLFLSGFGASGYNPLLCASDSPVPHAGHMSDDPAMAFLHIDFMRDLFAGWAAAFALVVATVAFLFRAVCRGGAQDGYPPAVPIVGPPGRADWPLFRYLALAAYYRWTALCRVPRLC